VPPISTCAEGSPQVRKRIPFTVQPSNLRSAALDKRYRTAAMLSLTRVFQKLAALLFLIAVVLVAFFIVVFYSRQGGVWVAGYVTGIITVPFVGFGVIRAINALSNEKAFIGTVVFGLIAILISLIVAFWSIFGSPPQL
jgi:hypothetical protein